MLLQPKSSPFVFIVPFAVMFAVVGVAMFAAGSGTDLRSHASTGKEKQCAVTCSKLGGSAGVCTNVCPKIIDGSMTCADAAAKVKNNSKLFLAACEKISPIRDNSCTQICGKMSTGFTEGAGMVKSVCAKVCADVSTGKKTCDTACSDTLSQTTAGKQYIGQCTKMCAGIPVKSPTPSTVVSPTVIPTSDPVSVCTSKCKPPKSLTGDAAQRYLSECKSICSDITSGAKTCPTACSGLGSYWSVQCKNVLCN